MTEVRFYNRIAMLQRFIFLKCLNLDKGQFFEIKAFNSKDNPFDQFYNI